MREDDGYGRRWVYRVFSEQWTCPDDWNVGQRYLTVHRVDYHFRALDGTHEHPLPQDLLYIEDDEASPTGVGLEEALLDAERIMGAFDQPVLIKAEFQRLFDWSEKQNGKHAAQARARRRRPTKASLEQP